MKLPEAVMPPETAAIYGRLVSEPLLQGFVLIGGTALALHLGHRLSEDLDFLFPHPKLPIDRMGVFESRLRSEGVGLLPNDDSGAIDDFLNSGMELRDYHRNYVTDRGVKLTFFAGDASQEKLLKDRLQSEAGFSIASLDDLFALKAMVASTRSSSRDWLDLFLLCRDHGYDLAGWQRVYRQVGLSDAHFENALSRICSGRPSPTDPGFESLLDSPPTIPEIADYFTSLRRDFEVSKARQVL